MLLTVVCHGKQPDLDRRDERNDLRDAGGESECLRGSEGRPAEAQLTTMVKRSRLALNIAAAPSAEESG